MLGLSAPLRGFRVMMQALYLVEHRVNLGFGAHQLRERNARKRLLHDLVQTDDNGPDPTIARMHASIHDAGVALAVAVHLIIVKHFDDFAQTNL